MRLSARLIFTLVVPLVFAMSLASTREAHAATCDVFVFDVHAFSCADPFNPNCLTTSGPAAPAPANFVVRNDTSATNGGGPLVIQVQNTMGVLVYTSPQIPIGGELTLPGSLAGDNLITATPASMVGGWGTSGVTINPAPLNCTPPPCSPEFVFDVHAFSCPAPFTPNCLTTSGPAAPTPAAFVARNDTSAANGGGPMVIQVQNNSAVLVYTSPPIPIGGELTIPGSLAGDHLITATPASMVGGWSTTGVTINPFPAGCPPIPTVPAVPWPALAVLAASLALLGSSLVKRRASLR
jgi:hypothetical protein